MSDVYSGRPWQQHYDAHVQPALQYASHTFAEKFRDTVQRFPQRTALIYLGRALTFQQLDELTNQLANHLLSRGLKPGDVVGLHLPNVPANYLGVIAVQKVGCVSTGLSPLSTAHELEHQLNDANVKVVITVDVLFEKLAAVASRAPFTDVLVTEIADFLPPLKRVLGKLLKKIPTGVVTPLPGKTVTRLMAALKGQPRAPVHVPRTGEDPIFMMYTGGTTGPSKGAVLTQRSFLCNEQQVVGWLQITPDDVALSAFPLFHIAGLALGGFTLLNGVTQVCVPNPRDTDGLIKALAEHRPTMVVNVPTVYFELLKRPEFRALDFSRLKWCLSASAPFPAEYFKELEAVVGEGRFIELYGMTETSPVTCCNPRFGKKKPSSIGMPLADTEFKLVDPETHELVPVGQPGELAIRGPQLMRGYHNKPDETANAVRDGWMFTGDVARMDEDGYFFLVDRVKDMVIVSGYKVYTRELDELLIKHPDVQLAAAVGVPDHERPGSERVAVAVVLKPGVAPTEAQREKLTEYLRAELAAYKVPRRMDFVDALPTSSVGKILKRELKRQLSGAATH